MGRSKVFDTQEALTKAMNLFWQQGYGSTSLKDLLETMGIQNGSFYNCYRNKRDVYLQAMHLYQDDFSQKRSALFNNPQLTFDRKIRILFKHILLVSRIIGIIE